MPRLQLRYVDVQLTDPHFAGNENPAPLVDPPQPFELADDESIAAINERYEYGGTLGHFATLYARVWISRAVT